LADAADFRGFNSRNPRESASSAQSAVYFYLCVQFSLPALTDYGQLLVIVEVETFLPAYSEPPISES
jgi:hypothetical protein